jgi:hypothetical protein
MVDQAVEAQLLVVAQMLEYQIQDQAEVLQQMAEAD